MELLLAELMATRYALLNLFHATALAGAEGKQWLPDSVLKIRDQADAQKRQKARKLLQDFFAQAEDPGVEKHESDAVSAKVPLLIALGPLPRPRGPDSCLLSLHLQPLELSGLQRCPGGGTAHRFGRD